MTQIAHDLRDLLALARMLRRFAESHTHDNNYHLFLDTAVALEARARFIASSNRLTERDLAHDAALHAPVNMLA